MTTSQEEHEDVAPAVSGVQVAQLAIQDKAPLAAFWVSEIRFDALDHARRESDSGQRRLLRKLGFKFKNNPGETPEDPADGAGGWGRRHRAAAGDPTSVVCLVEICVRRIVVGSPELTAPHAFGMFQRK